MKKVSKQKKTATIDQLKNGTKHSIKNDEFDRDFFRKAMNEKLRELEKTGSVDYAPFSELIADTFFSLFKNHPDLVSEYDMDQRHLLNREVMKTLMENPKWKDLRTHTRLDILAAIIGTEAVGDELLEYKNEFVEKQKQLEEALKNLEEMQAGDGPPQAGDTMVSDDTEQSSEGSGDEQDNTKSKEQLSIEDAKKKLEELRESFSNDLKSSELIKNSYRILMKVHDKVTESMEVIQNWGLGSDATFQQRSHQEKIALLERLRRSEKLKKIADLAGRFKRMALSAQREKTRKGIDELYSITQGRNFGRMIPSQLIYLTEEHLEILLYNAYIEGRVLEYELTGKNRKRKGPIICALDSSGSMEGMAEIWSKAVALALLEVAKSQKRDFAAIHFSGHSNPMNLKTHEFKRNESFNAEKVIDMAQYFESGGTFFEAPLERARMIMDQENDWHKASIIFVTDGESVVGNKFLEQFLQWRDKHKVKIISIVIDTYYNTVSSVKEFSQEVYRLSELRSDDGSELAMTVFRDVL